MNKPTYEQLETELLYLNKYVAEVEKWHAEGYIIVERERSPFMSLFWLGHWWADRPWRNKI